MNSHAFHNEGVIGGAWDEGRAGRVGEGEPFFSIN